jgi:hypothetical protein
VKNCTKIGQLKCPRKKAHQQFTSGLQDQPSRSKTLSSTAATLRKS